MDSALAALCAEVSPQSQRSGVTFSLALAALAEPHWSALAPSSPLRRFRLIEIEEGYGVTAAPLRIDERVLHYLAGVNRLDPRLDGLIARKPGGTALAEEHRRLLTQTIASAPHAAPATVLHLCGDDADGQEVLAAYIADRTGRDLFILRLADIPSTAAELDRFVQLWTREARLLPATLLLQSDGDPPGGAAQRLAELLPAPLIVASRDALRLRRAVERYEVNRPAPPSQKQLWTASLGNAAGDLGEVVDRVAAEFRFSAPTIARIGAAAQTRPSNGGAARLSAHVWEMCRSASRPRLDRLAERIAPAAAWDDLVLPKLQQQMLRHLAAQSRHRLQVYQDWGFSATSRRGLGLGALFCGPSGTGKTLAAEVLASELALDLYRIDLSEVVSKYIGETEKNLRQVFDAAEAGGIVLLFDEADALFGKCSEVKDSHDRYANIEVSYLLQRMENFQGLAILTTNLKSSLDKAFQRRLRFAIDFPFPDMMQRRAIWARMFPAQAPTAQLRPDCLAQLNMTGGNIRNIAVNAAFLAAADGAPIGMTHVLQAARLEAVKLERPLAESETRGWA
jgi:ATPase family associated with various cellular activities (AAA)